MPMFATGRIQREGVGFARFYIEVADEDGGRFRPDPDNLEMFVMQDLAELAAENALRRFPVARVLEEKLTVRRMSEVE